MSYWRITIIFQSNTAVLCFFIGTCSIIVHICTQHICKSDIAKIAMAIFGIFVILF